MGALDDLALNQLFVDARTRNGWVEETLPESLMRAVYDLTKWGPTSANCSPARFAFVGSAEGKAKLKP
ncbi:MAG: nitroreductase family protein, partial [Hyphomonadaceae bacterium]